MKWNLAVRLGLEREFGGMRLVDLDLDTDDMGIVGTA